MLKGWADGSGTNIMLLNIKQFQCWYLGILSLQPDQIPVRCTVKYGKTGTNCLIKELHKPLCLFCTSSGKLLYTCGMAYFIILILIFCGPQFRNNLCNSFKVTGSVLDFNNKNQSPRHQVNVHDWYFLLLHISFCAAVCLGQDFLEKDILNLT